MFDVKSLFLRGKQLAGLDIGSSALKLLEIEDHPKGRLVTRFSRIPLARGVIVDGAVVDPEALTKTIKELYQRSGCSTRKIVTSIPGHAVIVKKAAFARMDDEELRALIHDETGKYLPFDDMAAVDYDFQILGEHPYNPGLMEVIIVAAKKEITESYAAVIRAAGLIPVIMDIDSFALETMYEENYEFDENDVAVLINIGASITNLNAVKGGMSLFTRDFALGGNAVTETLAANLGLSFAEAEKAKIEGIGDNEPARASYRAGLVAYGDPICSEIERSVDYFRSTFGAENIGKILLSGGGSLIPGMAAALGQRLGIKAEMANPFRRISFGNTMAETAESAGPIAAVGVGLALRKIGDS